MNALIPLFQAFLCWKNTVQECNYSKQVLPGFLYAPSLLSFAPACSVGSRSISNTIFPAYVTLYKRRNYQTSSRTAPRERSLHALIRAPSFIFILVGSIFSVTNHLSNGSNRAWNHPELPVFQGHKGKHKGEKGDGTKKGENTQEKPGLPNLIESKAQKKPEDQIYSHKARIFIPSATDQGHRWGTNDSGTIKSLSLLCIFKTRHLHG